MEKEIFTALVVSILVTDPILAGEPRIVARNPHKQLVLDSRVIESVTNARLVLGTVEKEARNPLFKADKPWENALNNLYPNVVWDEQDRVFKLWYKCVLSDKEAIAKMDGTNTIHDVGWYLLYATSRDGLAWDKPILNLHKFGGQFNNAVTRDTPNAGVFKDVHDSDPARRYKMIYDVGMGQLRVRFSVDGIHWGNPVEPKGFGNRNGDTHNNAFWDEQLKKYVLITRLHAGERLVARFESDDFLNWRPGQPQVVLRSSTEEGKNSQTYCMPSFPYANIYLGYVMMYHVSSGRVVDCELAWSPDSVKWERVKPGVPFIPRGPDGSYDSKCIYAPAGLPVAQDDRIMIIYGGSDFPHTGWKRHCLPCLARLRIDGFAGYEPEKKDLPAVVVTQPLVATGDPLRVSADAKGGTLQVEVVETDGFKLDDCELVSSDVTDCEVKWKGGKTLAELKGKTVRLKFVIRNARLYAFSGCDVAAGAR
jgi:hypothetical protein